MQICILVEFVTLFVCFIVIGVVLILKLQKYFNGNYQAQRKCVIIALVLHVFAVTLIVIRQSLQLDQTVDGITPQEIMTDVLNDDFGSIISTGMFWFQFSAEYLPFVILLFCIWFSNECQFNYLMYGYLYKPGEEDRSTVIGSVMLAELQDEFAKMSDYIF